MFTTEHFIWIGLCASFVSGMSLFAIRKTLNLRQAGICMTLICIVSETSKILSNMVESPEGGMHLDPHCLPLHLCSLMIFVTAFVTFGPEGKGKQILVNFLAAAGTLGSVCAILIPTNGTDFRTPDAYQCFVYHAGLLWFSLYLILSGQTKLGSFRALGENISVLLLFVLGALYANGALSVYDTNFLYLTRPPMEGLPFLNLDDGWYRYFLRLFVLGLGCLFLFHLPFILKCRKPVKQA